MTRDDKQQLQEALKLVARAIENAGVTFDGYAAILNVDDKQKLADQLRKAANAIGWL